MSNRSERRRNEQPAARHQPWQRPPLPVRIDPGPGVRLMKVYVEGYGDVAFWRTIFNHYESPTLRFEIGVPYRADMAKGKQTLLKMYQELEPDREDVLLCMDSDFDYLFNSVNRQSYVVNHAPNIFHTYAYAFENYLCYAPSLHNVCVKSTKNDVRIFDFEHFLTEFSKTVYPLFLWYAHAALSGTENYFPLIDFRTSVKINYLDLADNGRNTIEWLARQVEKRIDTLTGKYPSLLEQLPQFEKDLRARGVAPENAYLYMQGHTLMDNVVMVALNAVCEQLKLMVGNNIASSQMTGQTLRNEMSNYSNELRNVRDTLLDNENYKDCFLYLKLRSDIETYLAGVV